MAPEITVKTSGNYEDAMMIRTKVFIAELHYNNESDDKDAVSKFVTVYVDGNLAGTGRIYRKAEGEYVLGRIAVLPQYRHRHLGSAIIKALESMAQAEGGKTAYILSCSDVVPFYESLGYARNENRTIYDEGRQHVWMQRSI